MATLPALRRHTAASLVLSVIVGVALAYDASVHLRKAPDYAGLKGTEQHWLGIDVPAISMETLFKIQGIACLVAAIGIVLLRRSWAWRLGAVVALLSLLAVLASVYTPFPAIGPFPKLDEQTWDIWGKKSSAFAELVAVAAAIAADTSHRWYRHD
jgi:hypothetical protein